MTRVTAPVAGRGTIRSLAWPLAVTAVVLVAAYLTVGAMVAREVTQPNRTFLPENGSLIGAPYADVRFPARVDGVQIAGWYVPRDGGTRAVIIVHGKDQSRTSEFFDQYPNGRLTEMAGRVGAAGFAVLMIDLRGHGESGDARFSFGQLERRDVMGAADWLRAQGFQAGSIGALGISLGAASAVGAAAEDSDIGAVVVDSGFAEFCPVLEANWSTQAGMPDLLLAPTLLMTRIVYGIDICAAKPVNEIGRIAPRPVLIIHSTADQAIPVRHAQLMQAALPSASLWVASGREHARNYNADPDAYVAHVTAFFEASLKE